MFCVRSEISYYISHDHSLTIVEVISQNLLFSLKHSISVSRSIDRSGNLDLTAKLDGYLVRLVEMKLHIEK